MVKGEAVDGFWFMTDERTEFGDCRVTFTTKNLPAPLVANVKILRGLLKPKTFSEAIFT